MLRPEIANAIQLGKFDQANLMSEIQRALELRYPHKRFPGFP